MPQPLINITRKHALIFAGFLVLYEFLTYIANDMIMPAMIHVAASFHAPETSIASSLTAYVLGGASLQLFLGPLSDRYGRRPVMLYGALFFLICTIFIACSTSIDQFLIARYFQGMGLCFIGVVGYATLQEIFSEMDAIRLISVMANVSILAPLLGPLIGAVFINYFSWRMIFVFIALLALISVWGLQRFMPESVGKTRHDGEEIKAVPLSFKTIAFNYKNLLTNPSFILGSIALGLLSLPCVAWIGLAPVILVIDAKLSMMEYGLWQLPVFSAYILGNIILQRMTSSKSIQRLIWVGSIVVLLGLSLMLILSHLFGNNYIWLLPGLIIYFFAYGMVGAPINRFILFSTHVSKGTASALLSMFTMAIQGGGIELANLFYATHSNHIFAQACAVTGIVYSVFFVATFYSLNKEGV